MHPAPGCMTTRTAMAPDGTDGSPAAVRLHLSLPPRRESLDDGQRALSALLHDQRVDRQAVYRCELVLEELLTNVLLHGQVGDLDPAITLTVEVQHGAVLLVLEDGGVAFDPLTRPDPLRPTQLANAPVGGLGLMLVRRMARELRHERVAGRNRTLAWVAREPSRPTP